MSKIVTRYLVFIAGLYFLSLGVASIVTSTLGTTPISSVNYVLSLHTPFSLGTTTCFINMLLIIGQLLVVGTKATRKDIVEIALQVPFSLVFGAFIDFNMWILSGLHITSYAMALSVLACGCVVQALGVVLELKPQVAMMSAEAFVRYASERAGKDFGKFKVCFDLTLVSLAALLGIYYTGSVEGIREGTLIAAISTGFIVSFMSRYVVTRSMLKRVSRPLRALR